MINPDNSPLDKSHIHANDTLLDSLIFICRMYGIGISRDALSAGLPLSDGKITPALFKRAAARADLSTSILKKPLTSIRTEYLPAVLLLENSEACLLVGFDVEQKQARVVFPEAGDAEVSIPLDNLAPRYSGYAIVVKPKFNFDQRAPIVGKVKLKHWFWGVLAENSNIYRDIMLAAFLINLFALAMPLFSMNVYDRIVPNHAVETLWVLVIGVSLMIGADWLLRTIRAYFLDWASHRVDIKLSASIMEQVLGLRMDQRPMSVGSFAANLRSFETVRDFITSATVTTIIDIPFAIIFIAVMAWVSVWMIIPVVIAIVVMLVYALSVQAKMHDLSETMYRAGALRNATLIESLVGLETVKSLGIESHMQRKWELSAAFLTEVGGKLKTLSTSINHTAMSIQQLVTVILVLLGVYLVVAGHLTMGGMIACTMLAGRALAPFAQAAGLMAQYYSASTSLASLDEIMSKPIERPVDASFLSRPTFNGDIEFREVTFNYPGTDMHALRNVSFKIRAGEHVALLGRMGSGKTTIHKLILGLYQPLSGSILIDGIDTRQIDPAELRRSIGCVQQDTQLFFGTMRDNIAIAAPYASDEQIINAAKTGGIDEFINHHPKGFDMPVGERGETLSGGQRQGVGIARAMVQEPAIVLLDEPTSAMDFSGEEMVKKRLIEQTQGKTLLVISHRSSLFDMVERIIVIDNGKIVADGNKLQVIEALKTGQIGKSS